MIKFCGFLAALTLAIGTMSVEAFAGYGGPKFRTGNWTGQARFTDSGQFQFCTIHARYDRGNLLFFNLNRKLGASIGLVNPRWRLTKGRRIPISIFVDGRLATDSTAKVIARNHVVVTFPTSRRMFSMLRRGRSMAIATDAGRMRFSLRGTSRALVSLVRCVQNEIRIAKNRSSDSVFDDESNPFAENGSQTARRATPRREAAPDQAFGDDAAAPPRNQSRSRGAPRYPRVAAADAEAFATRMLNRSGIARYQIIPRRKHPLKGFAVMWRTRGGIVGGLNAYRDVAQKSVNKETAYRIATDTITCDGKFASGVKVNRTSQRQAMKRVFTACQGSKFSFEIHYTFKWTDNGDLVEVMNARITKPGSTGPTDRLQKVDDQIHDALFAGST